MDITSLRFVIIFEIFVAIWLIHNTPLNNAAIMKFTNYVCESLNTSIIQVHQCRLKAVKRDVVTLNFNATLLESTHSMRLKAQLFKKANGYKPWLYKIDIDACRYLEKPYNPIAIVLLNNVLDFSNFNHSCPYKGIVYVQDWYLRPEIVRLPYPTGDYLIETKWYFNRELSFMAKYYFTFVEN